MTLSIPIGVMKRAPTWGVVSKDNREREFRVHAEGKIHRSFGHERQTPSGMLQHLSSLMDSNERGAREGIVWTDRPRLPRRSALDAERIVMRTTSESCFAVGLLYILCMIEMHD